MEDIYVKFDEIALIRVKSERPFKKVKFYEEEIRVEYSMFSLHSKYVTYAAGWSRDGGENRFTTQAILDTWDDILFRDNQFYKKAKVVIEYKHLGYNEYYTFDSNEEAQKFASELMGLSNNSFIKIPE